MHPAEHRALRELYAFTRQLAGHWDRLAERLGGDEGAALDAGAKTARKLMDELADACAARDLYIAHMVRFAGRFASARPPVADRLLERNQALRFAALDAQHVATTLAYVGRLAATDGDAELEQFCTRWERKVRTHERGVRNAAIALGDRPDEAIAPAEDSPAGRAGQRVGYAFGTVGEWVDRQAAKRRSDS